MESQRKALAWISIAMAGAIIFLGVFGFLCLLSASLLLGADGLWLLIVSFVSFLGIVWGAYYSCQECLDSFDYANSL